MPVCLAANFPIPVSRTSKLLPANLLAVASFFCASLFSRCRPYACFINCELLSRYPIVLVAANAAPPVAAPRASPPTILAPLKIYSPIAPEPFSQIWLLSETESK